MKSSNKNQEINTVIHMQVADALRKNNIDDIYKNLKLIWLSVFLSYPDKLEDMTRLNYQTFNDAKEMISENIVRVGSKRLKEWCELAKKCNTQGDIYTALMIVQAINSCAVPKPEVPKEITEQAKIMLRDNPTIKNLLQQSEHFSDLRILYKDEDSKIFLPQMAAYVERLDKFREQRSTSEDTLKSIKLINQYLDAQSIETLVTRINSLSRPKDKAMVSKDPEIIELLKSKGMDAKAMERIIYFFVDSSSKTLADIEKNRLKQLEILPKLDQASKEDQTIIQFMRDRATGHAHAQKDELQSEYKRLLFKLDEYHNKFLSRDLSKNRIDKQKKEASQEALDILRNNNTNNEQKIASLGNLILAEGNAEHKAPMKEGTPTNLAVMLNDVVSVIKMLDVPQTIMAMTNPITPSVAIPLSPPAPEITPPRTPEPLSAEASPTGSPERDINKPQAWVKGAQKKKVDMKEVASKLGEPSVDKLGPPPTLWQAKKAPTAPRDRNVGFFERKPSAEQQANTNEQKENPDSPKPGKS